MASSSDWIWYTSFPQVPLLGLITILLLLSLKIFFIFSLSFLKTILCLITGIALFSRIENSAYLSLQISDVQDVFISNLYPIINLVILFLVNFIIQSFENCSTNIFSSFPISLIILLNALIYITSSLNHFYLKSLLTSSFIWKI